MEEAGEAYWQFMTGSTSPYRCLFEHGRPERLFFKPDAEGVVRQSGFVMNNIDIVDPQKTTLVYNFVIAMRMVHEYPETIRSWHGFLKLGMDGVAALYLSRMFVFHHRVPDLLIKNQMNDGCHWPLWFNGAEYEYGASYSYSLLNFDRLYEGRPNFKGKSCAQWTEKGVKKFTGFKDFATTTKMKECQKGVFSNISGYDAAEIIEEFQVWLADYRKTLNEALKKKDLAK